MSFDFAAYLAAATAALQGALPDVPTVAEYPRLRKKITAPAVFLELAAADAVDPCGTGELSLGPRFEARVVFDRAPTAVGLSPDLQALSLATALALQIHTLAPFGQPAGAAKNIRIEPDHFRPDLAEYAVWLVTWDHPEVRIGESVWDGSGVVPTEIYLGLSPDIGIPHEPDYVLVSPVRAVVTGAPESPTDQTGATLTVSGTGLTHYCWRLDGGAWSGWLPLGDPIELTDLADGLHQVDVVGGVGSQNQPFQQPTTVSWTVDTTPPEEPPP